MSEPQFCNVCGGPLSKGVDDDQGVWDCPGHCHTLSWDGLTEMYRDLREENDALTKERDDLKGTITEFFKRDRPRREEIKLLGGYLFDLTREERLEWHEWIRKQAIYRDLRKAEAIFHSSIMRGNTNVEWACEQLEDLKREVYDTAKAWCKKLEKRRGE